MTLNFWPSLHPKCWDYSVLHHLGLYALLGIWTQSSVHGRHVFSQLNHIPSSDLSVFKQCWFSGRMRGGSPVRVWLSSSCLSSWIKVSLYRQGRVRWVRQEDSGGDVGNTDLPAGPQTLCRVRRSLQPLWKKSEGGSSAFPWVLSRKPWHYLAFASSSGILLEHSLAHVFITSDIVTTAAVWPTEFKNTLWPCSQKSWQTPVLGPADPWDSRLCLRLNLREHLKHGQPCWRMWDPLTF